MHQQENERTADRRRREVCKKKTEQHRPRGSVDLGNVNTELRLATRQLEHLRNSGVIVEPGQSDRIRGGGRRSRTRVDRETPPPGRRATSRERGTEPTVTWCVPPSLAGADGKEQPILGASLRRLILTPEI